MNDVLMFELPKGKAWRITWSENGQAMERQHVTGESGQTSWEIHLPAKK
jgi:hypothetical protein